MKDFKGLAKAAWILIFIVCGVALIPFLGFASWLVAGPVLLVTFIMSIMVLSRGGTLPGIFLLFTSIIVAPVFIACAPFLSSLLGLARVGASMQNSEKSANKPTQEKGDRIASSPLVAPKETESGSSRKLTLSEQTKAITRGLTKPVQAIIYFAGEGEAEAHCRQLLREYEFASKGKITVEEVRPLQNLTRARELQTKYKFGANENIVILDYEGKSIFINSADMAEFEQLDQVAMLSGRHPRMIAFKGEQLLTNALIELTEEKQKKIYILGGHVEYDFESPKNKVLKEQIRRQNITVEALILTNLEKVPDDASALIILSPRFDYSERDLKLLTDYWDRKGRLFIAIGPVEKRPSLDNWLAARGVQPMNDTVLRVVNLGGLTGLQELEGIIMPGSPITKALEDVRVTLIGRTESLHLDRSKEMTDQLRVTGLLSAPEGYWGETEYAADRKSVPSFDPKKDNAAPLTLAASVEKGASHDPNVKLVTARMIVFGSSELFSNEGIIAAGDKAFNLSKNAFNWLLNRDSLMR